MATANEEILNALIRHQIYLMRHSGYIRNRVNGVLDKTELQLAELIRSKLRAGTGLTTPVEYARLQALLDAVTKTRTAAWADASNLLISDIVDVSYNEPTTMQSILFALLPVTVSTVLPSARLLRSIALSKPFEGRILKDWAAQMQADDIRRIHSVIQAGMVSGSSTQTIVQRVIGTSTANGEDGITQLTRRNVQAIVRTAVAHVANGARREFILSNQDVVSKELFVATLDARTTPTCRGFDGKEFPIGKGPQPPLHFNCRSLRVAAVDSNVMSTRPANPSTEKQLLREFTQKNKLTTVAKRDDLPYGTKGAYDSFARTRIRELVGPVPASETYQTWLTKQPAAVQDDILGRTRGVLFRQGGITLDKFINRQGDELTLHQLSLRQSDAFKAAGLNPADY